MTSASAVDADIAALLARLPVPVTRITSDSRRMNAGDAFAAYPGAHDDGRRYIGEAVNRGAGSILWDPQGFSWDHQWKLPHLPIDDLKLALGAIADHVYGHPSRELWMVGVTGTNGKTSCAHWVAAGLDAAGRRSALLGTLGNGMWGALQPATNTTPDAAELHETLRALKDAGAESVSMEVSSHGLDQGRVNAVAFDVALFTNLSRDHLDYHGTMAAYGAAKSRLFRWPGLRVAVINADDAFGKSLIDQARAKGRKVLTYGFAAADVVGGRLVTSPSGLSFTVETPWGKGEIHSPLVGAFNAANLLGVISVLLVSGVAFESAIAFLAEAQAPPGRMQRLGGGSTPLVVIDYAHTPDALEQALRSLRDTARGALAVVFGCGGDRDRGKRAEMGSVAARFADRVYLTNDNPRTEEPRAIVEAIAAGIGSHAYAVELDRRRAIERAIAEAHPGDVVLVAGKGHETYQIVGEAVLPFDDAAVVRDVLATRGVVR